jgi:hypothetical protein
MHQAVNFASIAYFVSLARLSVLITVPRSKSLHLASSDHEHSCRAMHNAASLPVTHGASNNLVPLEKASGPPGKQHIRGTPLTSSAARAGARGDQRLVNGRKLLLQLLHLVALRLKLHLALRQRLARLRAHPSIVTFAALWGNAQNRQTLYILTAATHAQLACRWGASSRNNRPQPRHTRQPGRGSGGAPTRHRTRLPGLSRTRPRAPRAACSGTCR